MTVRKILTTSRSTLVGIAAFALAACSLASRPRGPAVSDRIARVEQGLLPTTRVANRSYTAATIEERMAATGVPAVSIAIVNDGRIEWAKAYGFADVEARRPVTPSTLFQAASISKPVAALGALRMVEQGRLSLDEDVNAKLRSWRLPENELTARQKVTLRLLLTHSAGTTVHGFPGYAPGAPVPEVVAVLEGQKPANTAPVRVDIAPGNRWRYSGGGTTVMQILMTDVSGMPFPALMHRLVLHPIGMMASTFEQPLPASRAAEAATGYRSATRAVTGRYHTYPEMAAAGLWTTPSDLARLILEVQRSLAGTSNKVLSQTMTRAMLTRGAGSHGLGPSVDAGGDSMRFGHGGANEGFRATFTGFVTRGQGAVVMTNSDAGGVIAAEIIQTIAREYRWPGVVPRLITPVAIAADILQAYVGTYSLAGSRVKITVTLNGGRLMATQTGGSRIELVPTGADLFMPLLDAPAFRFERDSSRSVTALAVGSARLTR